MSNFVCSVETRGGGGGGGGALIVRTRIGLAHPTEVTWMPGLGRGLGETWAGVSWHITLNSTGEALIPGLI